MHKQSMVRKVNPEADECIGLIAPTDAGCLSSVLVLRNDRNCMHPVHHLAGVDLVRG
jgi:hypothetical protein